MGERKGQHLVVKALAQLPDEITLLMVGPYRELGYEQKIEQLIERHGLSDRVDCLPFMEHVERAYRAGSIYLLPSTGEGMPNGMLEAMACGLVPIGTRISGIEDLIREGCGKFVTREADSIAEAIRVYFKDPEMLAKEQATARTIALRSFSSQTVSAKVLELLSPNSGPPKR